MIEIKKNNLNILLLVNIVSLNVTSQSKWSTNQYLSYPSAEWAKNFD